MAKRILVPLDGTPVGEQVLSLVADAARSSAADVRLLHVCPVPGNVTTPDGRIVAYADQEMDRIDAEHTDHLRALADAHMSGMPVDCVVRFGEPGAEILKELEAFDADLVAVATKTRSSITRALLGSVAEEVVHKARVTVILVRPAP